MKLTKPLLEDPSMVGVVKNYEDNSERNEEITSEISYIQEQLAEKRLLFEPVAAQAVLLYETVEKMNVLRPEYHLTQKDFMDLFVSFMESRNRGKGASGKLKLCFIYFSSEKQ